MFSDEYAFRVVQRNGGGGLEEIRRANAAYQLFHGNSDVMCSGEKWKISANKSCRKVDGAENDKNMRICTKFLVRKKGAEHPHQI